VFVVFVTARGGPNGVDLRLAETTAPYQAAQLQQTGQDDRAFQEDSRRKVRTLSTGIYGGRCVKADEGQKICPAAEALPNRYVPAR